MWTSASRQMQCVKTDSSQTCENPGDLTLVSRRLLLSKGWKWLMEDQTVMYWRVPPGQALREGALWRGR